MKNGNRELITNTTAGPMLVSTSLQGTEFSYGVLVSTIFVPATGPIGPTLVRDGSGTHKPVKMTLQEQFVRLEIKDKVNQSTVVLVPITSFTHLVPAK